MIHEFQNEAFIYLWYDAPNKKYYLGKHKGSPDDSYTHSSESSAEFCSIVPHSKRPITERREFFENMPEGISRKKIAEGTDEEMCILENKLLINRKNRCWNRYYNQSLGDPRYVDQSGENNPMFGMTGEKSPAYKHGMAVNIHNDLDARRAYENTPERRERETKRLAAFYKSHRQTSEYKTWRKKYDAERYARKKAERQGEGTLEPFMG